uniref:Pyridoxine 5'-phosphate synthase n=1 Tax=candidate division WOR-3 bacterium TaxID=2052148 RepID=A0A7V3PUW8_UNCW3
MRMLSVNIDHIATLRQARQEIFPDPVQAALLVELGGGDGVTVHLRQDQRHINFRDVKLLRETIKTYLTVEMAATPKMLKFISKVKPDQVTLVPEVVTEVTTTEGVDVIRQQNSLKRVVAFLRKAGIRVCIFVEPEPAQIKAAAAIGAEVVELNTDRYSKESRRQQFHINRLKIAADAARASGLTVHVGHGLNYQNVVPIVEENIAQGFSIGFSIVARAIFIGLKEAVAEMKRIIQEV